MLLELRVQNLLLIERADLDLAPGLNVLTGETGAGKTVLAHALDLLLGGRPRPAIVRPGAREAYVEGVFDLPDGPDADLAERLPEGVEELVLARRVGADGRTRAYLNGRTITVGDLRAIAEARISFYGQHEHRKLTLAGSQLEILDGFCGAEQHRRRTACAAAHARVRELEDALAQLTGPTGARERELDLLSFELAEIEAMAPDGAEHAELLEQHERLRHAEALRAGAWSALVALSGADGDDMGAASLLAGGVAGLDAVAALDPALAPLAERQRALALEAADLASELRNYLDGLDSEPERLEAVQERLEAMGRLIRKHGGSIDAVLAHAQRCRERREALQGSEQALGEQREALDHAQAELQSLSEDLRRARRVGAPRLGAAVRERLAGLAMAGATFDVKLGERALGPSGADAVELLIAANPGVPPGPLREIASGGELSRVMLALMGVAQAGGERVLVFDEVDAGIGGHTARAVGDQLRALAHGRQVLCITHLPQIASLGARHFSIVKDSAVEPARTTVARLADAEVLSELVRMLGSDADDAAARRHATELRRAA